MTHKESSLQERIDDLATKIHAPSKLLPTFYESNDFGRPHIEINDQGMHWVVVERSKELERKTTNDEEELLYWVFEAITFSMATEHELMNRIENEDFRRQLFSYQLKLLEALNPKWKVMRENEIKEVLKNAPFRDE
jgi:hypothetical protein